jgi:UTP--glucose-1-phosphate uridylyltransferase
MHAPSKREKRIVKAVIPAAGYGTRMLPVTKSVPKEMLTVGRKPMIQHAVEEAAASGLTEVAVVIREGKEIIRDYFIKPYTHKRDEHVEELERLQESCSLTFIYQQKPLGLGDALLQARDFVGSDYFVMLIPDQLMLAKVPAALQLINACEGAKGIGTSLVKLPKAETTFFAGARGFEFEQDESSGALTLGRIQTEDETRAAFSHLDYEIRGFGRTVYPPEIFDYLGTEFTNPRTGEVDLLKTFESCAQELGNRGVLLEGEACDLGTFEGYYRYVARFFGGEV